MIAHNRPIADLRDDAVSYIAELLHRIDNDYASAISFASVIASRSSSDETKFALASVIDHLHAAAGAHRVLRPPAASGSADFTHTLSTLCRAMMASSHIRGLNPALTLSFEGSVVVDAMQSWVASLIISEVITNAFRHAFGGGGNQIWVTVSQMDDTTFCEVRDNGSVPCGNTAGCGTRIVNSLATRLGGAIERHFSQCGSTISLSFPSKQQQSWIYREPSVYEPRSTIEYY